MLGLYLKNPSDLELRDIPSETSLKDDEVKIKLIYGGICGSDLGVYKGKIGHASYPVQPGHELLGTVTEAGEKATHDIGQKVVVEPNSYCGECEYCQAGKTNICKHKKSLGVNADGGFAEEFVISSKYAIPVPEDMPDEKAVLIEPFSVIVHALKKVTITEQTSIAIIGCGTEGMIAIALADYLGANITAIDISEEKLAKVKSHFPDVHISLPQDMNDRNYDVVVEAAGVKSSFEQGIDIVKPGGSLVAVGLVPEATVPVTDIVRKEITIYGSIIYNLPEDFQTSIEYLSKDDLNIDPVVSEIFPLKEYEKAYEYALSGRYGKIIIDFKEENTK